MGKGLLIMKIQNLINRYRLMLPLDLYPVNLAEEIIAFKSALSEFAY